MAVEHEGHHGQSAALGGQRRAALQQVQPHLFFFIRHVCTVIVWSVTASGLR